MKSFLVFWIGFAVIGLTAQASEKTEIVVYESEIDLSQTYDFYSDQKTSSLECVPASLAKTFILREVYVFPTGYSAGIITEQHDAEDWNPPYTFQSVSFDHKKTVAYWSVIDPSTKKIVGKVQFPFALALQRTDSQPWDILLSHRGTGLAPELLKIGPVSLEIRSVYSLPFKRFTLHPDIQKDGEQFFFLRSFGLNAEDLKQYYPKDDSPQSSFFAIRCKDYRIIGDMAGKYRKPILVDHRFVELRD